MNLVCSGCGKTMEAPMIARFQHTLEDPFVQDTDGHHIAINAERTWCDGEWLEWTEYAVGYGMPWNGGVVGAKGWVLADGRTLWQKHESWQKADGTRHLRQFMDFTPVSEGSKP